MMYKIMRYILYIILLIVPMMTVTAVSEIYYTHFGIDKFNSNQGGYIFDAGTTNWLNTTITYPSSDTVTGGHTTAVIGNVDSDANTEIIYNDNDTLWIISYDEDTNTFYEDFSISTIDIYSQITLFDGDSDGRHEIYFCGVNDSVGNSTFYSFEVENGNLIQKWARQVADKDGQHNTDTSFGCGHTNLPQTMASANSLYAPVCTSVTGSSDKYCLFIGTSQNMTGTSRRTTVLTVYRFDAENGDMVTFDPIVQQSSPSDCYINPGLGGSVIYHIGYSTNFDINGDEKNIASPLCDIDTDGVDELFVIGLCADSGETDFRLIGLLVDIDDMDENNNFDSDGLVVIDETESNIWGSASCIDRGDGYRLYITRSDFDTYSIQYDGTKTLVVNGVGTDTEISNQAFGEFNGDSNLDIITMSHDSGNKDYTLGGGNIAGLISDTFTWNYAYSGAARELRSSLISAENGQGGEFGGTTDDDVAGNMGIFEGNKTYEDFNEFTYSIGYNNGQISMGDINQDGFADIIVKTTTNLKIFISNTSVTNGQVDLIQLIPDVRGRPMCVDYNQSYQILVTSGYLDAEGNNVRIMTSCQNNGTYQNSTFYSHGQTFDSSIPAVNCYFNTTGTYTTRVCMQDNLHEYDYTECINFETIVSSAEGCEEPDSSYDAQDVVVDEEGEAADETDTPADVMPDIEDTVGSFLDYVGARTQNGKDFWVIIFTMILMLGAVGASPTHGWFIAPIIGGLFLTVMTIIGVCRAVYLVVLILVFLFMMIFMRPSGGGNNGG